MAEWVDYKGQRWPKIQSRRRLKFSYPLHAALRAHVHYRDGHKCLGCGVRPDSVPQGYDGRHALRADINGRWLYFVLDHVLPLAAGGDNDVDNLQTLCERCNLEKVKRDIKLACEFKIYEGVA